MRVLAVSVIAVFMALVLPISSGLAATAPETSSAQQFVRDFYSWYAQIYDQENKDMTPAAVAMKMKPQLFSGAVIKG